MLLTVALLTTMIPATVFATENGEWGSDYDTATEFTISNEEELRAFSAMVNEGKDFAGKTVKLANNITMSDEPWVPIGSMDYMVGGSDPGGFVFAGIFNGQGNTISDLVIDCGKGENDPAYDAVGLFGYVSGTIQNVSLTGLSVSAACDYVGGIAGRLMDNAVISGCTVQGSISGAVYEGSGDVYGSQMGGIAGATENTCENVRIENCVNEADLDGTTNVGGIIGDADGHDKQSVTLLNCTNKGEINGGSYHVGGIVGTANGTAISGCTNEGAVTGTYDDTIQSGNRGVGGIVGDAVDKVELTDCQNSGDIVAPEQEWVGGIAGRLHQGSSVNGCTNSGAIRGGDKTGGIVGYADAYADGYQVTDCANTGSVSGANAVGGIVGHASASNRENANISVTECTNRGAVSGASAVGGIVGDHSSGFAVVENVQTAATVSGCINTGSVPAGAGAIVGNNNVEDGLAGKVESNFWFWPESVGLNAVGSGDGSAGSSETVKNNSSYDKDGNFNSLVVDKDGNEIPNMSGACEEFFGGHDVGEEWVTDKEPTCTEAGYKCKVCNRCGAKVDIMAIAALGHNVTQTGAKEATCLAEGYTGDQVCTVCGEVVERGAVIEKQPHHFENGKCTVCGAADPNATPQTVPPKTGDTSNIPLWAALLLVSGAGAWTAAFHQKRRKAK